MLVTSTSPLHQQAGISRARKMDCLWTQKSRLQADRSGPQQNVKERKSLCMTTTCRISWTSAEVRRLMRWSGRTESNRRLLLGKQGYYHYTTPAVSPRRKLSYIKDLRAIMPQTTWCGQH